MNFDVIKPDEIHTMYRQAANKREIVTIMAQMMCCDENEICDILGIPQVKKRKVVLFDDEKALSMLKSGATEKQIAKKFEVSTNYVYTWKLENGLVQSNQEREKRYKIVRELYDKGLTDPQISEETGLSIQQIYQCRKEYGLKANWNRQRDWAEDDRRFRPHYENGLLDREIASICGCNHWNVRDWRQRSKLPSNARRSHNGKKRDGRRGLSWEEIDRICWPLYEAGMNDPQIQEKTGIDKRTVCEWRKREQLPSQRSLKK